MSEIKVVHYINQFFAGIGGEEKADVKPEIRDGVVGPGAALTAAFKGEAKIVATVICGDTYYNENVAAAQAEILEMVKKHKPDLFIAGPAFNAGRYGMACGYVCKAVQDELGIPVVTAMYPENPGVDQFKKDLYIIETGDSAADMRNAAPKLAKLALKLARGEEIGGPAEEGYIQRGIRKNVFTEEIGAKRAVDMLVSKIKGESFKTEYPMPVFDKIPPNPAVKDMSKATIALVTSGGIVPEGNPDRIESSSASKYGEYDISQMSETALGGYDPVYANIDPNRVLPVDVLKDMEKEGKIGKLYKNYYTTVGNGTSVANAKGFAEQFSQTLIADGVTAVILTST
jgi:glycine reductase